MSLVDRVRGVLNAGEARRDSPCPHGPALSEPGSVSLEQALGGEWRRRGARCFVVDREMAADDIYGSVRVHDCATRFDSALARASLLMRNVHARLPCVFFDLETTGLSGGAGTYAFLIGCGWFTDAGAFATRQYFLTDYGDERPMLEAVAVDLGRAGVLVSFNGKSFDAPLLETRYLFHRLDWIAGEVPHLDVLHPARRFWGGGPEHESRCSLGALERRLIGMHRQDDVPGFEIPARYFQFVRSGDARHLSGVLEHNRRDLVSLALITTRLLHLIDAGPEATMDMREALALGHVYANAGLDSRAREAYRRAVTLSTTPGDDEIAALRALALAERRARAYEEAAVCWQRLLDLPGCPPRVVTEALEALAIHHEHRRSDLATARTFALRSLRHGAHPSSTTWNDAVRHRLARLERKLSRSSEPLLFPFSSSRPSCDSPMSGRRTSS